MAIAEGRSIPFTGPEAVDVLAGVLELAAEPAASAS